MKIKFIGTGNMVTSDRANTSILVDNILFDIGSGTLRQLEIVNIDFNTINYIVISHFHADHFLDIAYFLFKRSLTQSSVPLTIITPIGGKQTIVDLLNFTHSDGNPKKYNNFENKYNVSVIELSTKESVNFSNFKLTAYNLDHQNCKPINGYLLEKEGKKLSYCTDTAFCENYDYLCNISDYIFSDANSLKSSPMHIGAYELLDIAKNHPSKIFYAIHRSNFEDLQADNVIFPKDLDGFNI